MLTDVRLRLIYHHQRIVMLLVFRALALWRVRKTAAEDVVFISLAELHIMLMLSINAVRVSFPDIGRSCEAVAFANISRCC